MVARIIERLNQELGDVAELSGAEFWSELKKLHIARACVIVYDMVSGVVQAVEDISSDLSGVTGAQKKEAVVKWLNSKIDIKFIPEWLEEQIIAAAVDYIVGRLNNEYGKRGWFYGGVARGRSIFTYIKIAIQL